jgi:hypothetical protein
VLDLDSSANALPRFTAAGDLGEAGGEDLIYEMSLVTTALRGGADQAIRVWSSASPSIPTEPSIAL